MYILKCHYPLNPFMDSVDIFVGHVSEAHQQLIYPVGLEPPLTAELPTRSTQQWLGNDTMTETSPNSDTATDARELP